MNTVVVDQKKRRCFVAHKDSRLGLLPENNQSRGASPIHHVFGSCVWLSPTNCH